MADQNNEALSKIADEVARVQLSETTKDILDTFDKSIDKVFDNAVDQINKVRHSLDTAEETLKTKRNLLKDTMKGFIEAMQVAVNSADTSQKAIGEVLLSADSL